MTVSLVTVARRISSKNGRWTRSSYRKNRRADSFPIRRRLHVHRRRVFLIMMRDLEIEVVSLLW